MAAEFGWICRKAERMAALAMPGRLLGGFSHPAGYVYMDLLRTASRRTAAQWSLVR